MIDERPARPGSSVETRIVAFDGAVPSDRDDRIVTEEPLEIRIVERDGTRTVAVTMRTPGNDFELAAGFLYNEGIVADVAAIAGITYCLDGSVDEDQQYNVVNVRLAAGALPSIDALERHFLTTSACGVCGRAQLDALETRGIAPIAGDARIDAATIARLPDRLRAAQGVFEKTGGLHAAGVFTLDGECVAVREDVGRHNALDKLIGWGLLNRRLPFDRFVLLVSGRTSYEIVQKALVARIPIVCGVSAPSSLAVDVAKRFGMTLAGFVRGERFNIYAGAERVSCRR